MLTRDYLRCLREKMGAAVKYLDEVDEEFSKSDRSRFASVPGFDQANRVNAYGTYLPMEREARKQ